MELAMFLSIVWCGFVIFFMVKVLGHSAKTAQQSEAIEEKLNELIKAVKSLDKHFVDVANYFIEQKK